jgi:hypothetical protein
LIVSTLGVLFAISGITHGFFEVLQGNKPINGLFIEAIGESHRMWIHGGEGAITVIPNFMVTGIVAIIISLMIIVWSVKYVHLRHGPTVFLILYILLFLTGGGVGQILFFMLTWAAATRINKSLNWWQNILKKDTIHKFALLWPWTLAIGSLLLLTALWIATTGYVPGMSNADSILAFMLTCVGIGFILFIVTFISGFAQDIESPSEVQQVQKV